MIAFFGAIQVIAQNTSVMFLTINLDPLPGKVVELQEGVKAHNAKYHASGESKAYLFAIMTGPRSGQFAWTQGPMSYASLDKALTKEHTADWEKNVAAHCRNVGEMKIVKRDEARTYNPANEVIAENTLARIFYGVSNQANLLEAIGMVKKTFEAKKYPNARRVYTSEFRTKDGEDVVLIYPFSSFKEFEKGKGVPGDGAFEKDMISVHGEAGWKKFQELMAESSDGWYDEVRTMVK